jgi:predicted metal-binding protein
MVPSRLDEVFRKQGFEDFRWIRAADIVVAEWVRMKCTFGCDGYGQSAACPPQTPSVARCEQFFREYRDAVLFHFTGRYPNREERRAWTKEIDTRLVEVERQVFLAGYPKAFVLPMGSCHHCTECTRERTTCREQKLARPTPEAFAVDVFTTVRRYGYPIEVLTDYDQEMNRYAILLVE